MPITRRIPQITPIPIHTKTKAAELPSSKESDSAPEAEEASDGMDVLSVSVKEGVGSGVGVGTTGEFLGVRPTEKDATVAVSLSPC